MHFYKSTNHNYIEEKESNFNKTLLLLFISLHLILLKKQEAKINIFTFFIII